MRLLAEGENRFHQVRHLTEVARALTYAASQEEIVDLAIKETAAILRTESVVLVLTKSGGGLEVHATPSFRLRAQKALRDDFDSLDEEVLGHIRALLDVAAVIRTGRSQLHEEVPDSFLAEYVCEADHPSELRKVGLPWSCCARATYRTSSCSTS